MNKRILKIIVYNILFFFVFGFLLEICAFTVHYFMYREEFISTHAFRNYANMFSFKNFRLKEDIFPIEKFQGKNEEAVIVYGGSFAWGSCLEREDSPSALISKYTGKTVYNSALPGMGTAAVLYRLQLEKLKKEKPDVRYILYVFQEDHLRRNLMLSPNTLYNEFCVNYYLDKNNDLKMLKYNKIKYFLYSLYFSRLLKNSYAVEKRYSQESINLFKKIIFEIYNQSQEIFPNSKFIILFYYDGSQIYQVAEPYKLKPLMLKTLSEIKEACPNIIIVSTEDFDCGKEIAEGKYHAYDNLHPSEEVWQKIIPVFVKKYMNK